LGAPNGWDTTGRLQIIGCSVGESVHLISIGSTKRFCLHPQIRIEIRVGRRIVPISLPQLAIICLLKNKKESSNSIQENNNLQNKMVERTYHEVLSVVVDELLPPIWRSSLRTCISTKSFIGLDSRSRVVACKKNNVAR
jgi:hypothetical protein